MGCAAVRFLFDHRRAGMTRRACRTATSGIGHNNNPALDVEPPSAPAIPVLTVTLRVATAVSGLSRSTLLRRAVEGELETTLVHGRRLVHLASLKKLVGVTDA